jgi:hypothetical protein
MKIKFFAHLFAIVLLLSGIPQALHAQSNFQVTINGLESADSLTIILQKGATLKLEEVLRGTDNPTVSFDLAEGRWALSLNATGYNYPSAQSFDFPETASATINVGKLSSGEFSYRWRDDSSFAGHAVQTYVFEPSRIKVLESEVSVPVHFPAVTLLARFGLVLSDELLPWSSENAFRLFKTLSELPVHRYGEGAIVDPETGENIRAIVMLTADELADDIRVEYVDGIKHVTISEAAFVHAIPLTVLMDGLKGRFFSRRLSKALINLYTDFGRDGWMVNHFAESMFGFRFLGSSEETELLMNEDRANFQEFHSWEKIEILSMIHELPEGMHKQEGLKYMVRRLNGMVNPVYPTAPAIAWVSMNTVEFMGHAFNFTGIEYIRRLILHEKAHFLWAYTFDDKLKSDWAVLGGWFEDPTSESGWSTTNTTEFVTPYAHAINPDEDMAESIAYYVTNPAALMSRSFRKFEFIRDRVMHGTRYQSQIREDLTFQVYNLFPDYYYPGKLVGTEVTVTGEPDQDKNVELKFILKSDNVQLDGATSGYVRLVSSIGTIRDFWLAPENGTIDSVLVASDVFNKYMKSGYWNLAFINIHDKNGNTRHENNATIGFKLYINNSLEDVVPPRYNYDLQMEVVTNPEELGADALPFVRFRYSFYDASPMQRAITRIHFPKNSRSDAEIYEKQIQQGLPHDDAILNGLNMDKHFDMGLPIPFYYPSGEYAISMINAVDVAGNFSGVYFVENLDMFNADNISTFKDLRQSVHVTTPYPDYLPPELDVNRITVRAEPTNPSQPNGETRVDLSLWVRDHSDYPGFEAGVRRIRWTLRNPQGQEFHFDSWNDNLLLDYWSIERNPNAGEWLNVNLHTLLPEGSVPGLWGVSSISVKDRANNFKYYSFEEYIRFDIIQSDIELDEPLVASISERFVNTRNVENIGVTISCAPCDGLYYIYTIYSLLGGNVNTGEGVLEGNHVEIRNLNLTNVPDGTIYLTIQLKDDEDRLISTYTTTYVKDTDIPQSYVFNTLLRDTGISNLDNINVSMYFEERDTSGTYRFTLETDTEVLGKFKIRGGSVMQSEGSLVFEDIIDGTNVLIEGIDLSSLPDGYIFQELVVTDFVENEGEPVSGTLLKKAGQVRAVDSLFVNLVWPGFQEVLGSAEVELQWDSVEIASDYVVQFSADPEFLVQVQEAVTATASFTPSLALEQGKDYYWRVRSRADGVTGGWSHVYTFSIQSGSVSRSVALQSGWNMVGMPVNRTHESLVEIFPGVVQNSIFGYSDSYYPATAGEPGRGYWVRHQTGTDIQIVGQVINELQLPLRKGWNLISGTSHPVALDAVVDEEGILADAVMFGFEGMYTQSQIIQPGRAYWLRASDEGSVLLPAVASRIIAPADAGLLAGLPTSVRLNFELDSLRTSRVFMLPFDEFLPGDSEFYTLPPLPPSGVPDVRLAGDRFAVAGDVAEVLVSRGDTPITFYFSGEESADESPNRVLIVRQYVGEHQIESNELVDGDRLQLNSVADRLVVRLVSADDDRHQLPSEITLEQNFPNPFNPSTTIRYALPEAGFVRLEVFTVAGQRVAVLAEGERSAGWHSATFDGSGLASGVYIYRLQAGGFVQTRKLMLVK